MMAALWWIVGSIRIIAEDHRVDSTFDRSDEH